MNRNMYTKYPRTLHLPWSEGRTTDDKGIKSMDYFHGQEVVVTEKIDGENTTLYQDHLHARSIDSKDHPSRHWIKMFHSSFASTIPNGWRICGENVFAKHSIHYSSLASYFYLFSIWNDKNECLSWDESAYWAHLLGVELAPVLYRGIYDEQKIKELYTKNSILGGEQEGYVVRLAESFTFNRFSTSVAKFVRKDHIQTNDHWLNQKIVQNRLKKENV